MKSDIGKHLVTSNDELQLNKEIDQELDFGEGNMMIKNKSAVVQKNKL